MIYRLLSGSLIGLIIVIGEGILNGVLLQEQWSFMNTQLGLSAPDNLTLSLAMFKLFILGFIIIGLYELMCHYFGGGFRASLFAGFTIAFLIWGWALAGLYLAGYINEHIAILTLFWGFIEVPLATVLGTTLLERLRKSRKDESASQN